MANKPKPRKRSRTRKNFVAIPFQKELALSTLADNAVLSIALTPALTEDLFVMSVDMAAQIRGLTPGEGDPSTLGLAHSDYTNAEVAENLNVSLTGPGSKIEQERTQRLVRKSGVFHGFGDGAGAVLSMIGRQGSRVTRTKCMFTIQNPKTLNAWIQNRMGAPMTTGALMTVDGTIYGRWIL